MTVAYRDIYIALIKHNIRCIKDAAGEGVTPEQLCTFMNGAFPENEGEKKLNEIYTVAKARMIISDDSGGQLMRKNPLNRLFSIFRKQKP